MQRVSSRALLACYLVIIIWLVLFKFAGNVSAILHHHHRSLNLVPFAAPSRLNGRINYGEIIYNIIFFIPFGLLLDANFKKIGFFSKLFIILLFSVTVECIQYVFAIGATDVTDVITNTGGGLMGLILYRVCNKFTQDRKLDRFIVIAGTVLLVIFILFRSRVTFRY